MTGDSVVSWSFDLSKAPASSRLLVAWKTADSKGTCEARMESAFGYGEDTSSTWYMMSGEADGLGDSKVPGEVYAWAEMPKAPSSSLTEAVAHVKGD